MPSNSELADRLEYLADLLELDGADSFRLAAYRRAATRIRDSAAPVARLAMDGKATQIPGVGGTIAAKIVEISETGDLQALAKLRDRLPGGLVEVMHVPGLGPKTARKLWTDLGVESAADLKAAAEQGRLRELSGLGPKTEEKVLKALAAPKAKVERKTLLGRALPAVAQALEALRAHPAVEQVSEAGSIRRRCETVRDLDLIATATDPAALTAYFVELPWVLEVAAHGPTKATVVSHDGLRFDLRSSPLRATATCFNTSPARRRTTWRFGRTRSAAGFPSPSTASPRSRRRRCSTRPAKASSTSTWATSGFHPSSARIVASSRRPGHESCPSWSSWPTSRATCTCTPTGPTAGTRSRTWPGPLRRWARRYIAICDHAKRLREGRLERQAEEIVVLAKRMPGFDDPLRSGGGHSKGRVASIWTKPPRRPGMGDGLDPRRLRCEPGRASETLVRGNGESSRRLHRPSDRAKDQPAGTPTTSNLEAVFAGKGGRRPAPS